jgi:dihydrofolate synthase / folylpolyglutamate synthase
LETIADEIVVTRNSSRRGMDVDALARIATEIFGADRVTVESRLDDALETAITLAEHNEDDVMSGAGVLVTGSVVTAGEARVLLGVR